MENEKRYSIWLMPSGDVYRRLSGIISRLSEGYSAPYFEPHVTLLGGLAGREEEILSKASQLAARISPYEIRLNKVDFLDEYFRCLFIRAKADEPVLSANLSARNAFNRQHDPTYMPHLSLMYGNFSPEIKEEIIAEIGDEFNLKFGARSIYLFSTGNKVEEWHKIKEFALKR